jgi:peroxiredoxin Q/BCP
MLDDNSKQKVTMNSTMKNSTKDSVTDSTTMVGQLAPNIEINSLSGPLVNLSKLKGQKIVLYFYPRDNTPGCTTESIEFNNLLPDFKKINCLVYGISRDSVKSHEKFSSKYRFNFDLLSDEDEKICRHFDVIKEKNMYGKKVFGIERSTFIFDENGKLVKEYRKIKAEGHASEILNTVKSI